MTTINWNIFSYLGLVFAVIYRLPQIIKIYQTKRADDLSSYSYLTHNGAYICFITYLVGSQNKAEWVLCSYYIMGMVQNLIIFFMKRYYAKQGRRPTNVVADAVSVPTAIEGDDNDNNEVVVDVAVNQ